MTIEVKIDIILKALYEVVEQNDGFGHLYPKMLFEENKFPLTDEELEDIIILLNKLGFIVFQTNGKLGKRIYFDSLNKGKAFVETDSFSQRGTSILEL